MDTLRRQPVQKRGFQKVEKILKTSAELFAEQGYELTTTRHIAEKANLPIGTIYQFFPDKKSILLTLATQYGDRIDDFFNQMSKSDIADLPLHDFIERILDTVIEFDRRHPEYFWIFNFANTTPEMRESINKLDEKIVGHAKDLFSERSPRFNREVFDVQVSVLFKSALYLFLRYKAAKDDQLKKKLYNELKKVFELYFSIFFKEEAKK